MQQVLLTSEKRVKELAFIIDNVASEYILAAITEAQETRLKSVIGPALLKKVKSLIADKTIEDSENETYLELVEAAQYYLAYTAIVELTFKTTFKITNFGVVTTNDENVQVPAFADVVKVRDYYQAKADYYCIELQKFCLDNRVRLPELSENVCSKIHANLYSAASCGIWLGGPRGKGPEPRDERYKIVR